MLTPYLSMPMKPELGWHTVFETHFAQRKFIVSSPLWDAIMGADPAYDTTLFFPESRHTREPNQSSNFTNKVTGVVQSPQYLDASPETPRDLLKPGLRGPSDLCDVVEEYRVTSSFDILASIGGLLALLQGIHMFIFGRPLFWGMFGKCHLKKRGSITHNTTSGAKIISPFGFIGQFATKGFKKRLYEKYYTSSQPGSEVPLAPNCGQTQIHLDMTQFLLDYVVDMGPASAPNQEDVILSESDTEDREVVDNAQVRYTTDVELGISTETCRTI
ncbi:hypothetical protein RhiXN_08225 [Rhizoctonia solani]|uniref:Uncharacterized protein n=1 Tax=Rhizoctonia solani TaxID=456999 RepID=A0A8H8SZ43_9AGAM|nr:uncharacterized protein RhiXN_08225 [Rhizoctonia solani]QRW23189.1 hypothetical protein RhiXN_08225 [Rhizoctonia solani]